MLKTKMVLNASPATENTPTATSISTSVQAPPRLADGLINIVLDSVFPDERAGSSMMTNATIRPVQRDIHQHQLAVDVCIRPDICRTRRNRAVIGNSLRSSWRLGVINASKGPGNKAVGVDLVPI